MKKSIAILSVLATSAAFADTTVVSGNTFGFVPVTTASTGDKPVLTCVAVPVNGYTSDTSIRIAEVLQVTDLTVGDKLYTMEGGKYNEYTLSTEKTWTPSQIVTVGADGNFVDQGGTPANEATIAPGGAFWLQTQAEKISLMGDATEAASAATISAGWQLIGNPSLTTPFDVAALIPARGDVLSMNGKVYQYNGTTGKWVDHKDRNNSYDTLTLPVGQGAMYRKAN